MLSLFTTSLITGFSGAVMPGSLLTCCIQSSIRKGWRAGIALVCGHALLELILVLLMFFGMDVFMTNSIVQIVIGLAGGALLCYMGLSMIISAIRNSARIEIVDDNGERKGIMSTVVTGAALSATNPYFILWWAVVGLGLMMEAKADFGLAGVLLFYAGHILSDYIWYGAVAIAVSTTRKFISQSVYRIIIAILGMTLIYFGADFAVDAVKNIISIW